MNISNITEKGKCTGCCACEQVCRVHAITTDYNAFGFIEPKISSACTQCGLCLSVCQAQSIKPDMFHRIDHCYIAYAKNKKMAAASASGGAFIVIAYNFLSAYYGTVYGCCMDEQFNVFHIGVSNTNDLKRLQGSKYVQSNTKASYTLVAKELQQGKHVLYTGTPCQISGLKMFLGREWDTLFTIDLVCHGVPSQFAFEKYINYLKTITGKQLQSFRFRNRNAFDASGYLIKIKYRNGKTLKYNALKDLYFRLFSKSLSLNSACYQCQYAQDKRIGDVTIGDSAAAGVLGLYRYDPKSSIMINTNKGEKIWNLIKDDLIYTEIDKSIEVRANKQLSFPVEYSKERETVCKLMVNGKFDELEKRYPMSDKHISIHTISAKIPMFIKRPIYFVLSSMRNLAKM